jgi:Concanavalin A-like lectin/glucanases superfamily
MNYSKTDFINAQPHRLTQAHRIPRRRPYPKGCCLVFLLSYYLASGIAVIAQDFEITSVTLADGNVNITFPSRSDSYYLLNAAPSLSAPPIPTNAVLGSGAILNFVAAANPSGPMFFRVHQLPLTATNDILGDGIADGFKLENGLPVFGPSYTNVVPWGETSTWLQIYEDITNAAALRKAAENPQSVWRLKGFPIGSAGWQPNPTDAEYWDYSQCGFNTVLSPRDALATEPEVSASLNMAANNNLWVLVDTYTLNSTPWGGVSPGNYLIQGGHHPATEPELEWLISEFGDQQLFPRLAGFWLGDDLDCSLMDDRPEVVCSLNYLRDNAPDLIPWIDHTYTTFIGGTDLDGLFNITPDDMALASRQLNFARAPMHSVEMYPLVGDATNNLDEMALSFLADLQELARTSFQYKMLSWPIIECEEADMGTNNGAWVRFQAYSSLAYGARGLWYFAYEEDAGLLFPVPTNTTRQSIVALRRPLWQVVQGVNQNIAAWAPVLLTNHFARAFLNGNDSLQPGSGALVETMDDDLLVSVLVPDSATTSGIAPVVMVVDCRVDASAAPRAATIQFSSQVTSLASLPSGNTISGNSLKLQSLSPGAGLLFQINGSGFGSLSQEQFPDGPDGLIMDLKFDAKDTNAAIDRSGSTNNVPLQFVTKCRDGGMHFDGVKSYGLLTNADLPTAGAITLALWIRPTFPSANSSQSPDPYFPIFGIDFQDSTRFEIGLGTNELYPVVDNGEVQGNILYQYNVQAVLPPNQWTHLALCAQGSEVTIYRDGQLWSDINLPFNVNFDFATKEVSLGHRGQLEYYLGDMDGVHLWSRCLAAAEVQHLFKKGRHE